MDTTTSLIKGTYLRTLTPASSQSHSHSHSTISPSKACKNVLIYFITGNPGYIGYYHTFLDHLALFLSTPSLLPSSANASYSAAAQTNFTLLGRSLHGFEPTPSNIAHGPYDFPEVIDATHRDVLEQNEKGYDAVILIGHSVGSYIALEVLSRLRSRSSSGSLKHSSDTKLNAILLFPTVTHIAQSPSGVKFSTLFGIPKFPKMVHHLSQYGFWPLSDGMLKAAVKRITGMPDDAAAVTAHFLRSKTGVAQSLHMARDEMAIITEDKWDEEIWGAEAEEEKTEDGKGRFGEAPRLVFLFGEDDHWVADHTRDALIKARAGSNSSGRLKMVLDEDKIPHGFCIRHSEQVAEKCAGWVKEMIEDVVARDK